MVPEDKQALKHLINAQKYVYFAKRDNIAVLNKVMSYIKNNEDTKKLKIVHIFDPAEKDENTFIKDFKKGGEIVEGVFGPELIKKLRPVIIFHTV